MSDFIWHNIKWLIPTFITVVIAGINIWILVGQKKRSQTQICIDLMGKRVEIYREFKLFVGYLLKNQIFDHSILDDFRKHTQDSEFLFGEDIDDIKGDLIQIFEVLEFTNKVLSEGNTNTLDHEDINAAKNRQQDFLIKARRIEENLLFDAFKKYLDLRDYKLPKFGIKERNHRFGCISKFRLFHFHMSKETRKSIEKFGN